MYIKVFIFILFLGINSYIFYQEYNYTHYTVEDGLPSSEVYSTFQDSKGYIWFATDAGVSRFNGYEFKNFDVKDGLTDNTVFLIREDSKGRIWFGTFNRKLCYFYNDSIYPFEHNDKILKTIDGHAILNSLAIDKEGTVWMGFALYGMLKCTKNGNVELLSSKTENKLIVYEIDEQQVWTLSRNEQVIFNLFKTNVAVKQNVNIEYHNQKNKVNTGLFEMTFGVNNKREGTLFFSFQLCKINNQSLLFFDDSLGIFDFKTENINLKSFNIKNWFHNRILSTASFDGCVWVCVENEGIYMLKANNDKLIIEQNISTVKSVSRIFKDSAGGYWITTLKDGVYYLKTMLFKNENYLLSSIDIDSENKFVYLGLKDKKLIKKSLSNKNSKGISVSDFEETQNSLIYDNKNGSIISDGFSECLKFFYKDGTYKEIDAIHPSTKAFIIDSNLIYRVNSNGISKIVDDKEVYYSFIKGQKKYWCTSLVKDKKNIWIGTNQGLVWFDDETYKISEPYKNHKLLSTAITCLEKLNNNIILIGTKNYGLLLMKNQKIIAVINEKNGLVSNLIKSIHVDNQNEIWIGSNKGLSRLHYISPEKYTIQNITTHHGLISNEISHIRSYKNIIFLVTPKNLIEFDKTKLIINKTPSPIYITKFKVNDVEKDLKKNLPIELSYNENRIDIHFESLNYKSLGEIDYQYRLLDLDTSWQNTTQTIAGFYGLPSGNYTFEVKAKNEDGFWSKPVIYSFKINPPFWFTWWFISAEVIFVLLIIVIIFKYRESQLLIKSKNLQQIADNEKKIIELELKALKSQMNPHFIFNTLNSIQHFISNNNFKDTNRYISNFSKLIRMVLNQSDKNYITLREETEMLGLYLNLEQVRFSNEFEYLITIDENIDLDFDKIPPMLLQPFIENAIWHGLMNKKEKGRIEIGFILDGDYLLCSVTDNGIGRAAAEEIKATRQIQNKSVGMTITKERLSIINNELYESMNVEVIDLFDTNNQSRGTKVTVKIALT